MSDASLLMLILGFGVICKWAVQGAARNPGGTFNLFKAFFK